jgi:phytoene desaturase
MTQRHVIVIGGGVGGLAAAVRLAAKGVRVTLVEQMPRVGGKLNQWVVPHPDRPDDRPFTFDTGPSLITLPFVFKDLFEAASEDVRNHLPITKLDPISRFNWQDGATLSFHPDLETTLAQIKRFAPDDVAGFEKLFRYGQNIWNLAGESFLANSPEQMIRGDGSFNLLDSLRALSVPFRIGMFRKFSSVIDRHISHPRLREVLYQYATYSGASPFLCPATLAVIPYCEMHFCGWYIPGGLYTLAHSLQSVALKLGVDIRLSTRVDKINFENNQCIGITVASGERIAADAVVCNSDAVFALKNLIAPEDRPHRPNTKLDAIDPGGSGLILCLGLNRTYPQLAHHTKLMPADYKSDLRAMFETKTVPTDPCIYICRSTHTDPTQAPEGCDNWFVLVSAPAIARGSTIDWNIEGQRYQEQVLTTLENTWGFSNLRRNIVVSRRWTPVDLAKDYSANCGAIYGISSNGIRNAFIRPPNQDKKLKGLFFCGGSTHPGGGLPLVALSGKIAASLALAYLKV